MKNPHTALLSQGSAIKTIQKPQPQTMATMIVSAWQPAKNGHNYQTGREQANNQ